MEVETNEVRLRGVAVVKNRRKAEWGGTNQDTAESLALSGTVSPMLRRDHKAGVQLRRLRQGAGLTLDDVEQLSADLARIRRDPRLRVPKSRLCDIETRGRTPSIFCLCVLATAYEADIRNLLRFYGLPL